MPDLKQQLQKAVDAQKRMREAAQQTAKELEEQRKKEEQKPKP